jgi:1-acyl-sn-glycerol-3-phosphate acyltransferase
MISALWAWLLCTVSRLLTGVRAIWLCEPAERGRIYFANHRSHFDFLLIWACLPSLLRRNTFPVAAAEYWSRGRLRRYLANKVFHAVLVERDRTQRTQDPIATMSQVLAQGGSLILFPEGTRNLGTELLPFRAGLQRLASAFPSVELIPVWIENLGRVMPKGTHIPIPLLCSISFGPPLGPPTSPPLGESDPSQVHAFLAHARAQLLALAPPES